MKWRLGLGIMAVLGAAGPASATLTYTCDPNIDATQAGTCAALNGSTVAGVYGGIFQNVTANIYIRYGVTGVAQSDFNITSVTYAQYYSALAASTDNATALASLSVIGDPLIPNGNADGNISVTAALATSLNLTANNANLAGIQADAATACSLGGGGCYNGIITMTNAGGFYYPLSPSDPTQLAVDFFSVVEHETDEILGTISCIGNPSTDACGPGSTDASPADLFRYAAAGTRSFLSTSNGTPAYFSIDGGVTPVANYINAAGLGDFGDWDLGGPLRVQDGEAHVAVNLDISTDGGSEIAALNAVGFNLAVPEPGTLGLCAAGLAILGFARMRRRSQG